VLVVDARIQIPAEEFRFTFSRSGGPGGQNVNKVNSKVTLHWDVTRSAGLPDDVRMRFLTRYRSRVNADGELVIHSQRYRDQPRNREDCLDKLRQLIESVRRAPPARRPARPSAASRERRLQAKRLRADTKRQRRRPTAWD
jgi:ribosome-associated protein